MIVTKSLYVSGKVEEDICLINIKYSIKTFSYTDILNIKSIKEFEYETKQFMFIIAVYFLIGIVKSK